MWNKSRIEVVCWLGFSEVVGVTYAKLMPASFKTLCVHNVGRAQVRDQLAICLPMGRLLYIQQKQAPDWQHLSEEGVTELNPEWSGQCISIKTVLIVRSKEHWRTPCGRAMGPALETDKDVQKPCMEAAN